LRNALDYMVKWVESVSRVRTLIRSSVWSWCLSSRCLRVRDPAGFVSEKACLRLNEWPGAMVPGRFEDRDCDKRARCPSERGERALLELQGGCAQEREL